MPNLFENANYQAGDQTALTASLNSGHQWAMDKANLDIKRQQQQVQLQQAQDLHQEFQSKVDTQMVNEYKDWVGMVPGKLKETLADQWQDKWTRAGRPPKDTWIAAGKDQTFAPQIGQVLGAIAGPHFTPELQAAVNQTIGNVATAMGREEFTEKMLSGSQQALSLLNAARMRGEYMIKGTELRNEQSDTNSKRTLEGKMSQLEASNIKSGQQTYDKAVVPISFALDGISRMEGLMDKAEKGEIKTNKQFRSLLSNEAARVATQKSNYGEGTAEAMAIDSYYARLKDLISKVDNQPEDTLSPDFIKQERSVFDEMKGQYMAQHDRMANSKLGGAIPAQRKAIIARAQAFQKQYGKKFGKWEGPGLELGDEGSAGQAGTPSPNGAPAQPAASPAPAPGGGSPRAKSSGRSCAGRTSRSDQAPTSG
jgi:hypothetical protein